MAALVLRQVWFGNVVRVKSQEESSNPGVWFAKDVFVVQHTRSREATFYAEGVGAFVTDKLREGNVGGVVGGRFFRRPAGGGANSVVGSAIHPGPHVIVGR